LSHRDTVEVEVKVPLTPHDVAVLRRRLTDLGFRYVGKGLETDTYFAHPSRDFKLTKEALRLRTVGGRHFLTYKAFVRGAFKSRKELEVQVSSGKVMSEILTSLGFKKVMEVHKTREEYVLDNTTKACIDDVSQLGLFLEIEVMSDDLREAEKRIRTILDKLSLKKKPLSCSYLELLLSRLGEH